ncbi:jg10865 [Pararge aegeria aegeria]|uniref:Jg10865 protein n=1 Tax=Pararge aegeria aegeria TaxID=348720 RepID=A0A8S4QHM8_9NEOP|nr:jg10865 [Pararge aegeria aegeria]
MRNVDLHRDLDLPTIARYMKLLSKTYFENAVRPWGRTALGVGPLVVEASTYTPVPDVEPKRLGFELSPPKVEPKSYPLGCKLIVSGNKHL